VRTCDCGDGVQCPNDRNPIFFTLYIFLSNGPRSLTISMNDISFDE